MSTHFLSLHKPKLTLDLLSYRNYEQTRPIQLGWKRFSILMSLLVVTNVLAFWSQQNFCKRTTVMTMTMMMTEDNFHAHNRTDDWCVRVWLMAKMVTIIFESGWWVKKVTSLSCFYRETNGFLSMIKSALIATGDLVKNVEGFFLAGF